MYYMYNIALAPAFVPHHLLPSRLRSCCKPTFFKNPRSKTPQVAESPKLWEQCSLATWHLNGLRARWLAHFKAILLEKSAKTVPWLVEKNCNRNWNRKCNKSSKRQGSPAFSQAEEGTREGGKYIFRIDLFECDYLFMSCLSMLPCVMFMNTLIFLHFIHTHDMSIFFRHTMHAHMVIL